MAGPSVYPIDYTNLGYESLREAMLAQARASLPEWTDQSENDLGVLLVELFAHAADITLYYQTRIASNLFPETADEPDAIVQLLRLIGYELHPPSPATVDLRVTFEAAVAALPQPFIPAGSQFQATALSGEQLTFETERDVFIQPADLEAGPGGAVRYLVPLPAVQGVTVAGEAIGTSDGSPNQRYRLLQEPVIDRSVVVEMTEPGSLITRWQAVETLANSSPADRHFITQRDAAGAAVILFGDAGIATVPGGNGANGLVPPAGSAIRATYRVGGGPQGNVPAKTVFTVVSLGSSPITPNDVREVINDQAAAGGGVAEDFDRARRLAPRLFRAQDRAVTLGDYQDLAYQLPGVGKARAVALNWNEVVLYIAPTGQVADPSELLRRDVLAFFESRRMATTSLRVVGPSPADVYLRATVQAKPFFRRVDVQAAVQRAVADYFAFDAVNFGDRVYLSKIYDVIQSLPQVTSLVVTEFSRRPNTNQVESDGIIELEPNELPRPGYRDNPVHQDTTRRSILAEIQGGVP
jgi:uncharacterized phage protein gp47/JayE